MNIFTLITNGLAMTNPGPWIPAGTAPAAKPRFDGLDSILIVVMALAGFVFVAAVFFAFADGDDGAFAVAGLSLMIAIMCGLGRVIIHIAQTLDRMANAGQSVQPTK